MKPQNTAIIGAGITGLYLAWKLSEAGHRVTVFEKRLSIGKEACSGLFSERILDFIPQSRSLVQNKIESALIHFPKRSIRIKFSKPFLVMSHAALDRLVGVLAEKAGTEIDLNYNCSKSNLEQLNAKFDRVIGCDGANSIIRNALGLKAPQSRLGIQGFVSQKDYLNSVETWAVKNGFIWKIPRGQPARNAFGIADAGGETEYGIIASPHEAKKLFDDFLEKKNIKIEKLVSALIPQGLIIPKNNSITLCGDAAGLTKPWSGGGVIWGLIAAEMLLKSFPNLVKYQHMTKRFFAVRIVFSKFAVKIVYFLGFKIPWLLPGKFKIESDFLLR